MTSDSGNEYRRTVKGRVPHKCFECWRAVAVGERHVLITAWFDVWFSVRLCEACAEEYPLRSEP